MKNKSIVVIGGGTGTFSVLSGLKKYTNDITAIVSMADSGGSAKKEKDEWGLLPSSDIRKSLIALADISTQDSLILRKLFQYRFAKGKGIRGMTFGNIFLIALTNILGSQSQAIDKASELLRIRGSVLPVTLNNVELVAEYEDGSRVVGEHAIDEPEHNGKIRLTRLYTTPQAHITQRAKEAIKSSDAIIIGPGGFYTTIMANIVVEGVSEAINKSKAKKIFILNLMTEYGQTFGFSAYTFIEEIGKYIDIHNINYVLVNNSPIPERILERYKKYHTAPVVNDLTGKYPFQVIPADLLSKRAAPKQKGDNLRRSFIRHNPEKLALICQKLL